VLSQIGSALYPIFHEPSLTGSLVNVARPLSRRVGPSQRTALHSDVDPS
jgi:hypothetical protein